MKPAIVILLLVAVAAPATAYSITNMQIVPNDTILAGDVVTASFTINVIPDMDSVLFGHTFNPTHSLVFATALDSPHWTRTTIIDGYASKPYDLNFGKQGTISGYDLAYDWKTNAKINITLVGIAPTFPGTSRAPILRISEINATARFNTDTYSRTIVQKDDLQASILLAENDLKTFEAHIREKQRAGLDVSAAEQQDADVKQTIELLKTTYSKSDYVRALAVLDQVRESLIQGERDLDRTYTDSEIRKSTMALSRLDLEIGWFTGNASTKTYPGLQPIQYDRNSAYVRILNATAAMNAGLFEPARADAGIGFETANSTYYKAIVLKEKAKDPLTPVRENLHVLLILAGAAILYLMFRKKKKPVGTNDGKSD